MDEDPRYGELKLVYKKWGVGYDATFFEPIEKRLCTAEELGMGPQGYSSPEAKFYPMNENHRHYVTRDMQKLYCVDEILELHGDYNSGFVTHFGIHLEKCNPSVRSDCKSDEEITQWLKRKFIITIRNNERFSPQDYSEDKVVQESVFTWHPVRSTLQEEQINHIAISRLLL